MNDTILLAIAIVSVITTVALALRTRPQNQRQGPEPAGRRRHDNSLKQQGSADQILQKMTEGVLVVDRGLRPEYVNPAARRLLGLLDGPLPARLPTVEVVDVARAAVVQGISSEQLVETFFPTRLTLRVEAAPFQDRDGALVVIRDVSEEMRTQRVRREFVAHASHELKSPVASLQTLSEAVEHAIAGNDLDTASRFTGKLRKESERLGKLVSDLLDLSRLEEPSALPTEPCDMGEVARNEVVALEARAERAKIDLRTDIGDDLWVRGDPQLLGLLIKNLLQNAFQYTPQGGAVNIGLERSGDLVVLRVEDNGIGIPNEAQSRVFERFYRVDRARSRDRGGTGLGLAIVKHVVELHDASIELESELGRGTTFTIRIPAISPPATGSNTKTQADIESASDLGTGI